MCWVLGEMPLIRSNLPLRNTYLCIQLNQHFKSEYLQINFFPSHNMSSFPFFPAIWQPEFLFWRIFFVWLFSCDFLQFLQFFLSNLMVIISLELTRANPDRNIFSINVELTSTFLLYRGLVRILNQHLYIIHVYICLVCRSVWIKNSEIIKLKFVVGSNRI